MARRQVTLAELYDRITWLDTQDAKYSPTVTLTPSDFAVLVELGGVEINWRGFVSDEPVCVYQGFPVYCRNNNYEVRQPRSRWSMPE